jgi:hypothetical protein
MGLRPAISPCGLSCDFFKCRLISRTLDQHALFARDHFGNLAREPLKFPEMTSTLSPFRTCSLRRFINFRSETIFMKLRSRNSRDWSEDTGAVDSNLCL